MEDVWIINGIPGSGKTTIAGELAKRFKHSVHIEGDKLQDFIISGNIPPGGKPQVEENRQIHLNVKNQCLLARSFLAAGFTPVIDYVIVNQDRLEEYKRHLPNSIVRLVILDPGIKIALERDRNRPEKTVAAQWIQLEAQIKAELNGLGLWINNANMTIEETIDTIVARANETKISNLP